MSKLEELIKEYCPDGVEHKKLEDIIVSLTIGVNPRKFFDLNPKDGDCFYVTVRELNGLDGVKQYGNTDKINKEAVSLINTRANIQKGDILFSNTGTVGKMALVLDTPTNWAINEGIYVIKPKQEIILSKFLYYWLNSSYSYMQYSKKFTGSTLKHVTQKALLSLIVPLPPLPVQREIVRILDNFTDLTAELNKQLTAELAARKKQYEYYRDLLINEIKDVKVRTLDEMCIISAGGDAPKDNMSINKTDNYTIPIISNGVGENAVYGYTDIARISEPAVTVAARGTIGYAEYRDYPYFPIIRLLTVIPRNTNELNPKYLFYCIQDRNYKVPTSGIPQLTAPMLKKEKILVPGMDVQTKIVSILDRFDALCNDLSSGLPAEIEARKKQYEYYRDKLLSFEIKG